MSVAGRRGLPGGKGEPGSNVQGTPGINGYAGNTSEPITVLS